MLSAMRIELPDGTDLELGNGATGLDAATAIGPRLAKAAVAAEVRQPAAAESWTGSRKSAACSPSC